MVTPSTSIWARDRPSVCLHAFEKNGQPSPNNQGHRGAPWPLLYLVLDTSRLEVSSEQGYIFSLITSNAPACPISNSELCQLNSKCKPMQFCEMPGGPGQGLGYGRGLLHLPHLLPGLICPRSAHPLPRHAPFPPPFDLPKVFPLPLLAAKPLDAMLVGQHRPCHWHCLLAGRCNLCYGTFATTSAGGVAATMVEQPLKIALTVIESCEDQVRQVPTKARDFLWVAPCVALQSHLFGTYPWIWQQGELHYADAKSSASSKVPSAESCPHLPANFFTILCVCVFENYVDFIWHHFIVDCKRPWRLCGGKSGCKCLKERNDTTSFLSNHLS